MEMPNIRVPQSVKSFIKGSAIAILILLMLIPTAFVSNLIDERAIRQREVSAEVGNKWASAQTLSGPFLYVPFKHSATDAQGKLVETIQYFWILPENLNVTGTIHHQIRTRSIFKVLLYRAELYNKGNFVINIPKDVDPQTIQWSEIRICYGLSDFKGIEERMIIRFNGTDNELSPGLPQQDIADIGLSAAAVLDKEDIGKNISFESKVRIKGSERLHFIPLSGNSAFSLQSDWPSPSFDGNILPSERNLSDSGFTATWIFNKANLPFGTVLKDSSFDERALAFGLTLIQPADQYAKAQRTVKYAILIIGLTFSLFFIVEMMQKRPVHPVQYVLVGMALVIFYTLLLSISEFLSFDIAYLIAMLATIALVALYAKGHFGNWRSAGIFAGILTLLYGFIFVLIRLEDTALLVGSIGLFIILSIAMYASRKVNWYGK
ncbi:MAG: cell envelope integrity protein CreD [Chitinophagaceae bacterium]|nr:cell envelope integrity protein CreD [Chitinophagaceae bacterium]